MNLYFRNTGSTSVSLATNWSTTDGGAGDGRVPIAGDNIFFTALSGNCNIGSSTVCANLDFTGYTGSLSASSGITISGNLTLSATMNFGTYTGQFTLSGDGVNFTSNGKTFPNIFFLSGGSKTFNFVDNWTVQNFTTSGVGMIINGGVITILGSFTCGGLSMTSTSTVKMAGTGSLAASNACGAVLTIDTLGTITIGASLTISKLFTYIRGTLITTGSTLQAGSGSPAVSPAIIDLRDTVWDTIACGASTTTATFISGFICNTFRTYPTTTITALIGFTFAPSFTYRITGSFIGSIMDSSTIRTTIKSTVTGTRAQITLNVGASCNIGYTSFTDIDASQGRAINIFNGIVSNCINVNSYNDPIITQAKSFVS